MLGTVCPRMRAPTYVYPASWRDSVTIVLRKPGKANYTVSNVHWPVALLNTMVKVLSACVAENLTHVVETQNSLKKPLRVQTWTYYYGFTTLCYVVKFVKDAWRRKEVVSALFLDIKSTFPSIILDQLVHNMRNRGVPRHYTNWIAHKVSGCHTTLKFNG